MGAPLSRVPADTRRQLSADLSYLDLAEIRTLCRRLGIPYRVEAETPAGGARVTADTDRKPVVLDRLRRYLETGEIAPATRISAHIVRDEPPPRDLRPTDRLYYRWYNKTYRQVVELLQDLTGHRFRDGALARVLVMEFWSQGTAPTLRQFADAWTSATCEGRDLMSPDYAYLTDLGRGEAGPDWKKVRRDKAHAVLATLDELLPDTR